MGRPLRYPVRPEHVDPVRWPHAVEIDRQLVGFRSESDILLDPRIEAWLRENVRRGGWRFSTRSSLVGILDGHQPPRRRLAIQVHSQLHLADPNDAFAVKMRWG